MPHPRHVFVPAAWAGPTNSVSNSASTAYPASSAAFHPLPRTPQPPDTLRNLAIHRLKWILRGVEFQRLKYPARRSTLAAFVSRSGFLWSWRRDLNPRPSDYKSDALPAELRQLFTHPETRPEADSCADTLQLSAYTAQNTRLAHSSTASKRASPLKITPANPKNKAFTRTLPVTLCRSGSGCQNSKPTRVVLQKHHPPAEDWAGFLHHFSRSRFFKERLPWARQFARSYL